MEVLNILFILSGLCRITGHSVFGMIGGGVDLWVAGRIHTQPPSRDTCFLDLQGSLWCSTEAVLIRNMDCSLLWHFKAQSMCTRTRLFWIAWSVSPAWGSEDKEETACSCALLNLAHDGTRIWIWGYWSMRMLGIESVFQKHRKWFATLRSPPHCRSYVWWPRIISKISRLITWAPFSDSSNYDAAAGAEIRAASLPAC